MQQLYLLLGSNLGDKKKYLEEAEKRIAEKLGDIQVKSSIYVSEPWGFTHKEDFFNRAILVDTNHSATDALKICLEIENNLGRERNKTGYEARTIDIDILLYGSEIIESKELTAPHPQLHLRKFTLFPLYEIAPKIIHPVFKTSILELLEKCPDRGRVEKLNEHD